MLAESSLIPDLERINALLKNCTDAAQEINDQNLHSISPEQFGKIEDAGATEGSPKTHFIEHFSGSEERYAVEDRSVSAWDSPEYSKGSLEKHALEESAMENKDETSNDKFCSIAASPEQTICDQELLRSGQTEMSSPKSILKSQKNVTDSPAPPARKFTQYLREKNRAAEGGDVCVTPAKMSVSKRVKFDLRLSGDVPDDDDIVSAERRDGVGTSGEGRHHGNRGDRGTSVASPTTESCDGAAGGQAASDGWCWHDSGDRQQPQKFVGDPVASCRNKAGLDNWTSEEHGVKRTREVTMNSVDEATLKRLHGVETTDGRGGERGELGDTAEEKCVVLNTTLESVSQSAKDMQSDNFQRGLGERGTEIDDAVDPQDPFITKEARDYLHIRRTSASAVEQRSPNMETPIHFANIVEIIHRDAVKTRYEEDDSEIPNLVFSDSHAVVNIPDSPSGPKDVPSPPSLSNSSPKSDSANPGLNNHESPAISSAHNDSESENTDSEDEDDGTMIIHDVENDIEDASRPVISSSFPAPQHADDCEIKISSEHFPLASNSCSSASSDKEDTFATATAVDRGKEEVQQAAINIKHVGGINPLQTLDSSRLRSERGVYSRMFLRQFKSNIYKKKQTLQEPSPKQHEEFLGEEHENKSQPFPALPEISVPHTPAPQSSSPSPQTDCTNADPLCTNADLMQKIDHIGSLLDQFISSNSSTGKYLGASNHQRRISDREVIPNNKLSRVKSARFFSIRKTCASSIMNGMSFLIALFLYMLSVFALLRVSMVKLDVSLQHRGAVPV